MKKLITVLNFLRGKTLEKNEITNPYKVIVKDKSEAEYKRITEAGYDILQNSTTEQYYYYTDMSKDEDKIDKIAFYKMIESVNTIKKCMIFFTILTCVSLISTIIMASVIIGTIK